MASKTLQANFVTPEQVAAGIKDGSTICTIGMTLVSASESNLKAIEKSFLETGHPCNLTLLHSCGQSDRAAASSTLPTRGWSPASSAPTGASSRAGWT